jgi:hypothetical protein
MDLVSGLAGPCYRAVYSHHSGVSKILARSLEFPRLIWHKESLGSASKWSHVSLMRYIDSAWNSWWELRADADLVSWS